jgi:hypothetical protein
MSRRKRENRESCWDIQFAIDYRTQVLNPCVLLGYNRPFMIRGSLILDRTNPPSSSRNSTDLHGSLFSFHDGGVRKYNTPCDTHGSNRVHTMKEGCFPEKNTINIR